MVLGFFVAQTTGVIFARAGDNVVVVRETCNLFELSCVKVGLSWTGCIHCLGYLEARVASYKSVRDSARKCSEIHCIFVYYAIIT